MLGRLVRYKGPYGGGSSPATWVVGLTEQENASGLVRVYWAPDPTDGRRWPRRWYCPQYLVLL